MNKKMMFFLVALAVLGVISIPLLKKSGNTTHAEKINPAFSEYISAFTSGYISSGSTIRIVLANEAENSSKDIKSLPTENIFDFSPGLEGKTVWIDSRTVEFRPAKKLSSGQNFEA